MSARILPMPPEYLAGAKWSSADLDRLEAAFRRRDQSGYPVGAETLMAVAAEAVRIEDEKRAQTLERKP